MSEEKKIQSIDIPKFLQPYRKASGNYKILSENTSEEAVTSIKEKLIDPLFETGDSTKERMAASVREIVSSTFPDGYSVKTERLKEVTKGMTNDELNVILDTIPIDLVLDRVKREMETQRKYIEQIQAAGKLLMPNN